MSERDTAKPPVPTPVTIAVVLVAVVLVVGAFFLGRALAGGSEEPTTPPLPDLSAPGSVGAFQLTEATSPPTAADVGKDVVRATYTDGSDQLLLVLSRPETDLGEFLAAAGIEELDEVPGSNASPGATSVTLCGRSVDTGHAACGRLSDGAGELLVGITDVASDELSPLLDQLHAQ